jgi:UDP-N-acetyl-D-galactosamine dehydrogenase
LINFDIKVDICDPLADSNEVYNEYGVLVYNKLPDICYDALILAVAHKDFINLKIREIIKDGVVFDVKGVLSKDLIDSRL